MTDLVWEDPPEPKKVGPKPGPRVEAMKARPGEWLLWSEDGASTNANALRKRGFEVRVRSLRKGRCRIWARWPAE